MADEPGISWIEVGRTPTREGVDQLGLVLQAVGIVSTTADIEDAYILIVTADEAERARAELDAFVRENRDWPRPHPTPSILSPGAGGALVYGALLIIFYGAQRERSYGVDWIARGAADTAMMHAGEWWRAITALGLHDDLHHLGGNLVFGALFGVMLAQSLGVGLAWLTFVLAGGFGNVLNTLVQSPDHVSIGASTGVFALLGAQVAFDAMRRSRGHDRALRRWTPIIMGIALLAWLGVDGERTDVAAHGFGFLSGLSCGALAGWRLPTWLVRPEAQEATGAVAVIVAGLAWALALYR